MMDGFISGRFPLFSKIPPQPPTVTLDECRRAGHDAAINGANAQNCHHSYFSSPIKKKAWEDGGDTGLSEAGRSKRPAKTCVSSIINEARDRCATQLGSDTWNDAVEREIVNIAANSHIAEKAIARFNAQVFNFSGVV